MDLEQKDLTKILDDFFKDARKQEHGRYKSWEYCYNCFQALFKKESPSTEDQKYAALMLGFFLASWGMLRNSFLLNCTYTVHQEAIGILLEDKSLLRKKIIANDDINDIKKLFELKQQLEEYYGTVKTETQNEGISQVLVTKILMGVSGLVPAYDSNVVRALRELKICQTFNEERSYPQIYQLYKDNKKEIDKLSETYKYPPMKILDIYLWLKGQILVAKDKNNKKTTRN